MRTSKQSVTPWLAMATLTVLAAGLMVRRRARRVSLRGRVAIVTGGGRGLGLAVTRELLNAGCKVAICGRDPEVIERALLFLLAPGVQVWGAACDASDEAQTRRFVEAVEERFGQVDLLVNNAGQCFVGPAAELATQDAQAAFQNIFWVHFCPTMAVLPGMRARGFGRIANITSIGGKVPLPHQAAYVAAKFAATGWSQTLATELAPEGIDVSTITPPPLRNGASLHAHFNGDRQNEFRWFAWMLHSRFTSTTAERTARVVVDALRHGDRERAVGLGAWLMVRLYGVAPNLTVRGLEWVVALMPKSASAGTSDMELGAHVAAGSVSDEVKELSERARHDEARYLPN